MSIEDIDDQLEPERVDLRIANARRYARAMLNSISVERQEMAADIIAILNGTIDGPEDPLRCEHVEEGRLIGERCRKRGTAAVIVTDRAEGHDNSPELHPFCDDHSFVDINEMRATSDDTFTVVKFVPFGGA